MAPLTSLTRSLTFSPIPLEHNIPVSPYPWVEPESIISRSSQTFRVRVLHFRNRSMDEELLGGDGGRRGVLDGGQSAER